MSAMESIRGFFSWLICFGLKASNDCGFCPTETDAKIPRRTAVFMWVTKIDHFGEAVYLFTRKLNENNNNNKKKKKKKKNKRRYVLGSKLPLLSTISI